MPKSLIKSLKAAKMDKSGIFADANRQIGGRIVLPGTYVFDADPQVKGTEFESRNATAGNSKYYTLEVQDQNGKWVSLNGLLRKTLEPGADKNSITKDTRTVFVNGWVGESTDLYDLADALAGKTLVVTDQEVETYVTFYDNEPNQKPRLSGKAYVAEAPVASEAPVEEAPVEEAPAAPAKPGKPQNK